MRICGAGRNGVCRRHCISTLSSPKWPAPPDRPTNRVILPVTKDPLINYRIDIGLFELMV